MNSDTGTPGRDSQTKTEERDKGREKKKENGVSRVCEADGNKRTEEKEDRKSVCVREKRRGV